jgi:hypothetical protein
MFGSNGFGGADGPGSQGGRHDARDQQAHREHPGGGG